MPKRPTEEQMERAVAAGDTPVSAKHPADEEWLAAQRNWLASHRTASRWLRKRKSAVRRVGRAALAPHRAPGAQAVRVICFSCGRTRPATICQAPVATRGQHGQEAMARPVLLELELDQEGVARGTRRDRTARSPRSRSHCSCRPHLLRAGPPRRTHQMCQHARVGLQRDAKGDNHGAARPPRAPAGSCG